MQDGERSRIADLGGWSERVLARFDVRLLLSAAIIASLLPVPFVEGLSPVFLLVFLVEFGLRVLAFVTVRRREDAVLDDLDGSVTPVAARNRRAAIALLVLDGIALASFVPIPVAHDARWLRVLRLTRMLALFGYWGSVWRDIWVVLARRERFRQLVLMAVVVGGLSFAGAVVLHHAAEVPFDADEDGAVTREDQGFFVLLWWAFRQVQDPGNMLESPMVASAVAVSLVLTVAGLFLVSFLIGLGTDVVRELVELARTHPPDLRGHTVIVNITPSTRRLLHELRRYYRKLFPTDARMFSRQWFADLRRRGVARQDYVVIGGDVDPPDFLRTPDLTEVVYRQRPPDEEDLLVRADLVTAKRILLLADARSCDPDAETIHLLLSLVERVRAHERSRRDGRSRRTRVVIAEILDESNLGAAQAAVATAGTSFRSFVVPTEKLLGLFFAGVVRRPGIGGLLEELLTSEGHEIYTCFFDTPGLGFQVRKPAGIEGASGPLFASLFELGQRGGSDYAPVVPLGVLFDAPGHPAPRDFRIALNTPADDVLVTADVRGVIALADTFASVRAWASAWNAVPDVRGTPTPATAGDVVLPDLQRTRRAKTTRVLVCGFRPGTIYMLEELFRSDPTGEVLVLVHDDATMRIAKETFENHTQLVERGLLGGRHGTFTRDPDGAYLVSLPESRDVRSTMRLEVADWMASRTLVSLPAGFGHVGALDAVVFVAGDGDASDPRTTTALLQLEQLCLTRPTPPTIVAEVFDDKLAARLGARARKLGHDHLRVYSIQELRAFFLFQAVVVPGFDLVYEELLGAWGQSLVHKHIGAPRRGPCTFVALSRELRSQGELLLAVELADHDGRVRMVVAPRPGDHGGTFDLARLRGCWVVAPDSGGLPTEVARDGEPNAGADVRALP